EATRGRGRGGERGMAARPGAAKANGRIQMNEPKTALPILLIRLPRFSLLKPPQLQILLVLPHRIQHALRFFLAEPRVAQKTGVNPTLFRLLAPGVGPAIVLRLTLRARLLPLAGVGSAVLAAVARTTARFACVTPPVTAIAATVCPAIGTRPTIAAIRRPCVRRRPPVRLALGRRKLSQDDFEVMARVFILRIQRERLAVGPHRLVAVTQLRPGVAEVVVVLFPQV